MKKIFVLVSVILLLNFNSAFSATGWLKNKPSSGDNPGTISTTIGENNAALDLMLSNFSNCKITYTSATTISVSAGGVMVSNVGGTVRLMLANAAATSVTFTNIDTGAEEASTTYYVYAYPTNDATTDTTFLIKVSKSATAPTGVTYYKRLGSFYNDASSNIVKTTITNDNDTSTLSSYDSGWFAIGVSGSYAKTHSLSTTKLLINVYFSASSDGSSPMLVRNWDAENGYTYGYMIDGLTTTAFTVKTAANGVNLVTFPNTASASGYYRVIALALP
jgi:hypothetical protein